MSTAFTSPEGRLVGGHPYQAQAQTDRTTNKPKMVLDPVTNTMQPVTSFYVKLSIPKVNPEWAAFKALLDAEAAKAWPQHFGPDGKLLPGTKFSTKVQDGDEVKRDTNGKLYSERVGYAGCWIVTFSSPKFAPTVFGWNDQLQAFVEGVTDVKLGDYARVSGTTSKNSGETQGMYVNLGGIAKYRDGEAISVGVQVTAASFPTPGQPASNGAGPTPAAASGTPSGTAQTTTSPTDADAPPPPYDGFVPDAPPAGPVMLSKAGTATYESFIAKGWTDALLVQHGMMAAK